ncbi:MAG: tetraacyldisaccharide 4'-kinase [Rickettsiales bacterium]|jgi:tetraacyldisaccharide 4'-kinase|nr:tetraacyldisaccharide 4'-kinase [Rickettsiales bacterium]
MRAPEFWKTRRPSIRSVLLEPLSLVYRLASGLRCLLNPCPYRPRIPVICVGGIAVGGSGKTPVAMEIAKILGENRRTYCFLTKGYGGRSRGVLKLSEHNSSARIVGDEPLLLFERGDTFVSKNRVRGLKHIDSHYSYDHIIMDDGLQNPTFRKSKKILVLDCDSEFKSNSILPAGPLRESFPSAVRRGIDLAVLLGEDRNGIGELCDKYSIKVVRGVIKPKPLDFSGKCVALCGIARPKKFEKTLVDCAVDFVDFISFEDHHSYREGEIAALEKAGYDIVTTRKDWVKIRDLNIDKSRIHVLEIFIDFANPVALRETLLDS